MISDITIISADVVEMARELEMEPKDVTERLSSYNKTLRGEDLLLMKSKESGFLRRTFLAVEML